MAIDNSQKKIVFGQILNPISDTECEFHKNGALVMRNSENGWIVDYVGDCEGVSVEGAQIIDLADRVIMPSFFDVHFHWVQDDVRTMPKAKLLEWLEKYTFPSERKFENEDYSKEKATFFFKRLARAGTLGGAVYSSIHEHALHHALEEVVGHFAIGNVQMTMNSPEFLTQTKEDAIELSNRMARQYGPRYALTPRFAIATDPETMLETGKVAKESNCFIQTHLSENEGEIDFVMEIYRNMPGFEDVKNYTDIYDRVGLLGPKTIMGHGIHLSEEELGVLARTQTAIAHCPTSNAPIEELGLGSGLFDFQKTNQAGVRWALASDIGGGPILSMFDVMRSFVEQNARAQVEATYVQALYRSTVAGAQVMGVEDIAGNLSVGKEANFIVLAPVSSSASSAEAVLTEVAERGRSERSDYDALPEKVFFRGEALFEA